MAHRSNKDVKCDLASKYSPDINNWSPPDLTKTMTDEIILKIFIFLEKRTLMKITQVCARWYKIGKDKTLWRVISLSPFSFELNDYGFLTLAKTRLIYTEKLHLSNLRVTFKMLRTMCLYCKSLETLLLGRNCSIDEARRRQRIAFPKHIKTLDMRLAIGNFDFLSNLNHPMQQLMHLGIGPRGFDKSNLLVFFSKLPNLVYIDFTNCTDLGDNCIEVLSAKCPNLESLCLIGCRHVLGKSFEVLLKHCRNLKTLLIRYLKIEDDVLAQNFWRESVLSEIDISACPRITSQGLFAFLGQLKHLEYLNMSYCGEGNAVNDTVLYEMANTNVAKNLKMIDLRWSFHITANALDFLLQKCCRLEHLGIYQSFEVKAETIAELLVYLPSLKILEFGGAHTQEISCGNIIEKLKSFSKKMEVLSLINFTSFKSGEDYRSFKHFYKECEMLQRVNFCDCSSELVKVGKAAAKKVNKKRLNSKGLMITTKWECALPPPRKTIDSIISH